VRQQAAGRDLLFGREVGRASLTIGSITLSSLTYQTEVIFPGLDAACIVPS